MRRRSVVAVPIAPDGPRLSKHPADALRHHSPPFASTAATAATKLAMRPLTATLRLLRRNAVVAVWLLNLIVCEFVLPRLYILSCRWPKLSPNNRSTPSHLLLLGDPQLTDAFSYRQQPGLLLSLTQFYSDVFMRRNYRLISSYLSPDYVIILGDLFDGGREWVGDREFLFQPELKRWNRIFATPPRTTVKTIAGNHDIGFQNIIPDAYARFHKVFGPTDYAFNVSGHTIVAVDSISLSAAPDSPFHQEAKQALTRFLAEDSSKNPRILLTHVPLYRPDLSDCGPLRNRPLIQQYAGYQYQNLITEPISTLLLDKIKPYLVLSGDDHDDCVYRHQSQTHNATEHTIATFSWLQGNVYPGFAVLSLTDPSTAPSFDAAHRIGKCALPPQLRIYGWYVTLAGLSPILALAAAALQRPWRRPPPSSAASPAAPK
ncbi:Metallo-dependent phosphatase-like protein, partial [Zopfochytrium polystomum]